MSPPAPKLRQRCIEPGRWIIEGRYVRAQYEGRGRHILGWSVTPLDTDGELPPAFFYLDEARAWIRKQDGGQPGA